MPLVETTRSQRIDDPSRDRGRHRRAYLYRDDSVETAGLKKQLCRVEGRAERLRRYRRRAERELPLFGETP